MKKNTVNELATAGRLIKDLKKYKKNHSDSEVVCILPDDSNGYITGIWTDKNGNICIVVDDDDLDGGCYDVDMVLAELESCDKNAKVYVSGYGYDFSIYMYHDDVFSYDEEEDIVICAVDVMGTNDETKR